MSLVVTPGTSTSILNLWLIKEANAKENLEIISKGGKIKM